MTTTDWITVLAALVGGLLGGGIPGLMTYVGWRRETRLSRQARRWQDAEVVADARNLLVDIDPARRGINANPSPGAEVALWEDLTSRRDKVRRELMVLATGHSSEDVRTLAEKLEPQLFMAAVQTQWFVRYVLAGRPDSPSRTHAETSHATADATLGELDEAVQRAGA
jgi:hypothetical protein